MKSRGFTLIESLIVLAIVVIITVVMVKPPRPKTNLMPSDVWTYCIDNVTYVSIGKGITAKLDLQSKVIPCEPAK